MIDPIVEVGKNGTNCGVAITHDHFEERSYWREPQIRTHLPRMLKAARYSRDGLFGSPVGRLLGPRQFLVRRGVADTHMDGDRTVLTLKNQDWVPKRTKTWQGEAAFPVHAETHRPSLGITRDLVRPKANEKAQFRDGQKILWNMWMLALHSPVRSPFGYAVRALSDALQHDSLLARANPFLSKVVCVPLQLHPFHFRSGKGGTSIPVFRDSQYEKRDGYLLVILDQLAKEKVEDITAACQIEARIRDEEKGLAVSEHVRRLTQLFPSARLHTFAKEHASRLQDQKEFLKRLAGSDHAFAYQVELDGLEFLQTYEDMEDLLHELEVGLYFGGRTEDDARATLDHILNPAEPIPLPVKEAAPEKAAPVPAFTSLREVEAWNKAAAG